MGFKRLLIVDDSEIDRATLKNILNKDFDIIEADNGYSGLEIILCGKPHIDGVLLDISMPVIDGFNVLRLLKENRIANLPVILITANATKPNVEKAIYYHVTEFLTKPFDAKLTQERLRTMFKMEANDKVVIPKHTFSDNDIAEISTYIAKLKKLYDGYMKNNNIDGEHYVRTSAVADILLNEYASAESAAELDSSHIDIIVKAAYFMDIGNMAIPDEYVSHRNNSSGARTIGEQHTVAGADIVRLNHSPSCQYFVKVCSDICMHHHERADGRGYPHEMTAQENAAYVQICSLAEKFDLLFSKRREGSDYQYEQVIREMSNDPGEFDSRIFSLLSECQFAVMSYYKRYFSKRSR